MVWEKIKVFYTMKIICQFDIKTIHNNIHDELLSNIWVME